MRAEELRKYFLKVYPGCSRRRIDDLVSAIISNKFWKVHSDKDDAYYAIALTRARIPYMGGFKAKSTAPGIIIVSRGAARFCRRGRVLVAKRRNNVFTSDTVIDWPAFLRIIKMDESLVYRRLVEDLNPPAFLNRRNLSFLLNTQKKEGE
ncbi:MAG: hypothetical protein QXS79_01850 [Candidatus Bathyarchaeia archaeon]